MLNASSLQRILYIEDDEGLARLLQRRLERQRFIVDTASSAEEGLVQIENEPYDLVLLDYHLGGMNGMELLDILSTRENIPPIILLTASGDEHVAVSALEKGAADYAVKDTGQSYFDLLPAIMQAAYTKELLLRENKVQAQELAVAKEKAEAANRAKSNFLATMSHEIRTPLNVVTGLASILAKAELKPEQKKIVDTLCANADLLLKLINDLLDISRIEGGHVKLEASNFRFSAILEDVRSMFEDQAQRKKIDFRINDRTQGLCFTGDRMRILQILINLVGNALKFTEGGEIEIGATVEGDSDPAWVVLTVRDTGIGMEAEKLTTIFDKFTQADETITRRYGGSGLGLSIAHSLTKLMDGDIKVESVVGKGSLFTATLKLPRAEQAAPAEPSVIVLPSAAGGTILLVDDYAPNIMVASMMLEELGYQVVAVESGAQAIAQVTEAKKPFVAILMDVQMQGMDGLETTRRIRQLEQEKGFRNTIIGVTAHALAGDREQCISAGMDDYVSKPIHPEILAAKLGKGSTLAA